MEDGWDKASGFRATVSNNRCLNVLVLKNPAFIFYSKDSRCFCGVLSKNTSYFLFSGVSGGRNSVENKVLPRGRGAASFIFF
jgi:hypothetical protein